eukprot:m.387773 g.387773  ORF g.387773 m.387773 type:complete len:650 (+) comp21037_c0_seq1:201-2150(+)
MEIVHVYQRKRAEFGRQCNFSDRSAQLIADIQPDAAASKDYIVRNPVDMSVQVSTEKSEHEVNTETVTYETVGINHVEGGWPKDVNPAEVEQTQRFRKKVEKHPAFAASIVGLSEAMDHALRQNNAVDVYENYFEGAQGDAAADVVEAPEAKATHVYRDPEDLKRSVTSISWYPEQHTKFAAAYSVLEFQKAPEGMSMDSYVWNVERPTAPETTLSPSSPLVSIEYNPKDAHCLLGGQYNGQLAVWDVRQGARPVAVSPIEKSHRDPVYRARFLATKGGTDAFSCSSDGQVLFWDIRKLAEPVETLLIDPEQTGRLRGGVALEYESTMPTKFMVGTEQGEAVLFNRKGKTPAEKISATYPCHLGPVYALERNPFFPKYFLSVGDWSMRTWCEDIKESAVMWTKFQDCRVTDGCWSPSRPAVCFASKSDGTLDVWDLLMKQSAPILSVKLSDASINTIKPDASGAYVACGGHDGTITLLELNGTLSNIQPSEKPNASALFDGEMAREKSVVARVRELRLRAQANERKKSARPDSAKTDAGDDGAAATEEEDPIVAAEKAFWASIEADKAKRIKAAKRRAEADAKAKNDAQAAAEGEAEAIQSADVTDAAAATPAENGIADGGVDGADAAAQAAGATGDTEGGGGDDAPAQ